MRSASCPSLAAVTRSPKGACTCRRISVRGRQNPLLALWTAHFGAKKVAFPLPRYKKGDVELVKELVEAGAFRAVIDRWFLLDDVVDATRYVETGQKTGNVVLIVGRDARTSAGGS